MRQIKMENKQKKKKKGKEKSSTEPYCKILRLVVSDEK